MGSRLIGNPATVGEASVDACIEQRFGQRRQSRLIALFVLCGPKNPCNPCNPWLNIIEFSLRSLCLKIRLIRVNSWLIKKSAFLFIFLLTIFENTLKYTYISQQANINRQQAKMTFQFACRKLQRSKDLEPASPDSWILNIEDPPSFGGVNIKYPLSSGGVNQKGSPLYPYTLIITAC